MPREAPKVRVLKLQEKENHEDFLSGTTPAERLQMMWELTQAAWTFKGEPVAEQRLPRHLIRVLRREG